jgi:hypothetical protein
VVICVAAVMPFAGRMETQKGAGWLGFSLGLAGGLASLWAMMTIQSRVPVEAVSVTRTTSQPADDATSADATPTTLPTTQPTTQPGPAFEHRRLAASEVGLLALVTVGTTVPFGVLVALLYHRLAQRRKRRLDEEWRVFRDED